MTLELVLFVAISGIALNMVCLWAMVRMKNEQIEIYRRSWARLNYLEVGMSYHGMIPMPWEVDEVEEIVEEIKTFKQEGNVVYLQKED